MRTCTQELIRAWFDGVDCLDPMIDSLIEDQLLGLAVHAMMMRAGKDQGCRETRICTLYNALSHDPEGLDMVIRGRCLETQYLKMLGVGT